MKYIITLNNKKYEVDVTEEEASVLNVSESVATPSVNLVQNEKIILENSSQLNVSGDKITSPMPGTVLSVNVSEGQSVKAGEVILVLEAMKMENDIVAPHDGVVKKLLVSKGSTVDTDQALAVM